MYRPADLRRAGQPSAFSSRSSGLMNTYLSYRRETALRGGLVMAKSERLELGYNTDIIGLYSTTVTYLASKAIEFGEKRKIRAITPFKVIEVGTNRNPVCDFLLVINSN